MDNDRVVLVVEDDASLRELIQTLLEDFLGLRTIPAADGEAALRIAQNCTPALMLLDIMLPGVDGFEVARTLKGQAATCEIPIIAVTASTSQEKALAAGCNDFVPKPFDIDFLLGKVERYVTNYPALACPS